MGNGSKRRAKRPRQRTPAPAIDRSPSWGIVYYETTDKRCGHPRRRSGRAAAAVLRRRQVEAMHGGMNGYYEIRLTGPGREQFRLFCLLENANDDELRRRGLVKPAIAVTDGRRKPWRTTPSARDYRQVKKPGEEHQREYPRRIAT